MAIAFAKEGADVAVAYLSEDADAEETRRHIEDAGQRGLPLPGDLAEEEHCREVVERTVGELGGLDVLVNNVAYQEPQDSLTAITTAQWERTLRTNITDRYGRR